MEFRLLGPLEALADGAPLNLGGRRSRALLARLLVDANRTVAVDRLVDDLWGDVAPASAVKMVQVLVSQLRKELPPNILRTSPPGYLLAVEPDATDVARFERLHAEGRAALRSPDPAAAATALRAALALWRGPALAELDDEPFAAAVRARLEELRLSCLEDRIEADLQLGADDRVVAELETLVAEHPLRERLRRQLMLALYRAGRQVEALAAYREYRRLLDDELGIEPSTALRELEQRILQQDPALDAQPPVPAAPRIAAQRDVRYVKNGDVSIAYQVVGKGARDIVLVHGFVCGFESGWERPQIAAFYAGLAHFGRLILFDKRGMGLSDRVHGIATLEERMDDVRAVLDAVRSERAVVIGISEGGPMVALFAATHPDRTSALIAMGTFARRAPAPDHPVMLPSLNVEPENWGVPFTRRWLTERAPSIAQDEEAVAWYASYLTRNASPTAASALRRMNDDIDVRHVLPTVRVPTLVMYREDEVFRDATRHMGELIPGARIRAVPGADHLPWEGDQAAVLEAIGDFLEGVPDPHEPERVLTTVLDVETTHASVREGRLPAWFTERVAHHRGRPVPCDGPALRATFDGPARALRCAAELVADARSAGIDRRAGVHTGECELTSAGPRGAAVDIARRVTSRARSGEVLASSTVRDLVAGSGLAFEARGSAAVDVDGEPREWVLFALRSAA